MVITRDVDACEIATENCTEGGVRPKAGKKKLFNVEVMGGGVFINISSRLIVAAQETEVVA